PWRDPAGAADIDHRDVDRPSLEHLAERGDAIQVFAAGDWGFQRGGDAGAALVVVGGGDILQPEQADILDPAADVDGLFGTPALVDVAHQLDVRPDRFTDDADAADFLSDGRVAGQRHLGLHLG